MKQLRMALAGVLCGIALSASGADDRFAKVEVKASAVAGGVHMLQGMGGNIAVFVGDDGVFMVDDQYAPLSEKIQAAVARLSDKPVRFVINTHWHGDHTGGNEHFGEAGALIVAHENVRERMSTEQFTKVFNRKTPPSPAGALPVITFTDRASFHWNGDEVQVQHIANAHTDGDALVYFKQANVLHMGDIYFNGSYPYIDVSAGGTVNGLVAAVDQVLGMVDGNTRIIPGHGPLSNRAELQAYRDLLVKLRDRIQALVDAGKSRDAVIAAGPTKEYDAQYGQGFMKPDVWTGLVYDSLTSSR